MLQTQQLHTFGVRVITRQRMSIQNFRPLCFAHPANRVQQTQLVGVDWQSADR